MSDRLSDRLPDHTRATTHPPGLFLSVKATPDGRLTRMAWKRSGVRISYAPHVHHLVSDTFGCTSCW